MNIKEFAKLFSQELERLAELPTEDDLNGGYFFRSLRATEEKLPIQDLLGELQYAEWGVYDANMKEANKTILRDPTAILSKKLHKQHTEIVARAYIRLAAVHTVLALRQGTRQ